MTGVAVYRTSVLPEWIDYNGHLRDAYYGLIVSLATDAVMDRIGIDESYRTSTKCTLYTLEMHQHFLREVKKTDIVDVTVRVLGADKKRIHAALDMWCAPHAEPVATAEVMLLHVFQGDAVVTREFPAEVAEKLAALAEATAGSAEPGPAGTIPGSRRMELRGR
jgi:acyl-CoA thioester hydrolase